MSSDMSDQNDAAKLALDSLNPDAVQTMEPTLPYGVGIDTHKAFIQVCVLYKTASSTERVEREFQTTWIDLAKARQWIVDILSAKALFTEGDLLRYTIESTGCYHLPVCQALGGTPSVINPMLAGPTRRKTDVLDARMLAHHSIVGLWPPSYVLTPQAECLRCLVAMRNEGTRFASRVINRINNHALRFGHTLGRDGSMADTMRRSIVEDLCADRSPIHPALGPNGIPAPARPIFLDSYALYDQFKGLAKSYHRLALAHVSAHEWPTGVGTIGGKRLLAILQSVPSVGEVTALIWLSVIHDPRRFVHKKQVAAFCGSDPSVKVSAGKTTSHVKRKGNSVLHHALKNCASMLVRNHKEHLGRWGYNILRRHRKGAWGRAISAVARRLAICLWHVHMKGEDFTYEKYRFYMEEHVPDMPVEDMDITPTYQRMLIEHGFLTSGDVARGFLTTMPQEKGLGVGCLTAVKQWIEQHKLRPLPQSNPNQPNPLPVPLRLPLPPQSSPGTTPPAKSSPPSPNVNPSSLPFSGKASQLVTTALKSQGSSLVAAVRSFLDASPPKPSGTKSPTELPPTEPTSKSTTSLPPAVSAPSASASRSRSASERTPAKVVSRPTACASTGRKRPAKSSK